MPDSVYAVTEIVGSSPEGVDGAIRNAVRTASKTLRDLRWFEVTEIRGHIENGDVAHVQATLKLGLRYDQK